MAQQRARRRFTALLALGALVVPVSTLTLGSQAASAAVGDGTLSVTLTQVTGTAAFDADDAAGHDSGPSNDIVRTNDTVTYTVGLRYEGEDQTNPTISFTLPKGEELVSLPPLRFRHRHRRDPVRQ